MHVTQSEAQRALDAYKKAGSYEALRVAAEPPPTTGSVTVTLGSKEALQFAYDQLKEHLVNRFNANPEHYTIARGLQSLEKRIKSTPATA